MTKGWGGGLGLACAFGVAGLACLGGPRLVGLGASPARDAGVFEAGPPPDGSSPDGSDGAVSDDQLLGLALPANVAPPMRLLDDRAVLLGNGATRCSHATPASADGHRWCAFQVPGSTATSTELWVMDVSAVAAGAPVACDGSHATCVRLSKTLWAPYGADFTGDTLVFYADAPAILQTFDTFVGPAYAWRPGWLAPRLIADHATVCTAARGAASVVCLTDPQGETKNPDNVGLRLGFLADVDDARLPALPGRYPLRNDGSVPWVLEMSPDGQTFALSVPDVDPGVASLFVLPVREAAKGTAMTRIIKDVQTWSLSHDGQKVFFYRGPRTDATLYSADFPSGNHELLVASKVVDYLALGHDTTDTALLLRVKQDQDAGAGHAFNLLRDRDHPATAQTLFTNEGFLEGIAVSPDLRFTAWVDPVFVGRSIRVSDLATCTVNPQPLTNASAVNFLDDGSLLFFSEAKQDSADVRDGWFTPPDACAPRTRYAHDLGFLNPIGTRAIVFGDARDDHAFTVTLKYAPAPFAAGSVAAKGGYRIHGNVSNIGNLTIIDGATSPTSVHLLYHATADGTRQAGSYLFGLP
ncbi:MAG TPA: hypothetical protein VHJ20_08055 [Polyangia bacterium]|nr:hypothetical protein [Polyangia bacterium]